MAVAILVRVAILEEASELLRPPMAVVSVRLQLVVVNVMPRPSPLQVVLQAANAKPRLSPVGGRPLPATGALQEAAAPSHEVTAAAALPVAAAPLHVQIQSLGMAVEPVADHRCQCPGTIRGRWAP